ncbi:restriction endonuclease subunit S [Kocuria atrinae]|uniref:Restriction endonuclease subunit S n=1 Tax=Kocuria atrinae TaxID=592377 RepID=A0ABN2XEG4_9MICC
MTIASDTGWIFSVPKEWRIVPLGSAFQERKEQTTSENDAPLSVTKSGVVEQLGDVALSYDGAPKKRVKLNDLVINSRSDRKGSSGLAPRDGSVSVINTVLEPRSIVPKFAHHLIRSYGFQEEFYRFGTGIVADLWSTRWSEMKNIAIPVPPLHEQQRIADYLDHETAEIDAFINDQQKFIELLVEHRMASVGTKIRYPSIFHDSSLLKHELAPLKRFGHVSLGKMLDTKAASGDDLHLDYLRAANVQPMGWLKLDDMKKMRFTTNEKRALDLREGDVVVVEGGVGGYGRAAFVPKNLPETGFQNSIIRVRPTLDNDGRYLTYALILLRHRGYITTVSSVASMPHFTAEKVARTPIPIATLDEQRGTADSLDDLWQSHEVLSSEAAQAIALARERRAALITAAVTGQIDVTAKNKPAAEQLEDDIAQGLYKES